MLFNKFITFIPFHTVRQGFQRPFGAKIGKDANFR